LKTIYLTQAIDLARDEPLLRVISKGQEFLPPEADDFEREAEILGNSVSFQRFLDERLRARHRIALEEIEAEVDAELARQRESS